jgi:hypothetical protein
MHAQVVGAEDIRAEVQLPFTRRASIMDESYRTDSSHYLHALQVLRLLAPHILRRVLDVLLRVDAQQVAALVK